MKEQLNDILEFSPISGVYYYPMNVNAPSIICFSSGTLDQHKGIIRTYKSWEASFAIVAQLTSKQKELKGIVLGALPYSLSLFGAMESLQRGVLPLVFSSNKLRFFDALNDNTTYMLWLTPIHCFFYSQALNNNKIIPEKRIKYIFVGGASFSNKQRQELQLVFPLAKIYSFFGTSETSFISIKSPDDFTNSVGKICNGVRLECRDDRHNSLPTRTEGNIWVKSNQNFSKYLDDNIRINKRKGYISVNDRGYIDEKNRLYFSGRKGRTVSISGHVIYLDVLELWYKENINLGHLALIAQPNTKKENELVLFISKKESPQKWKQLKEKAQMELGNHGVPKTLIHCPIWPMLENGKTDYSALNSLI